MQDSYVVLTAAKNEEEYLGPTIEAVGEQTLPPMEWIIVDDGSTDATPRILEDAARRYSFIRPVTIDVREDRTFASKAQALGLASESIRARGYSFVGVLDADVTFEADYYARLLEKFKEEKKLGIGGGVLFENISGKWVRQFGSANTSVSGPVQFFRRECYEDIGGYRPLRLGGIDALAEVMARMKGWRVRSFPDLHVLHHRRSGTEKNGILKARFKQGKLEYAHGYHPLFEILRCVPRVAERPYLIGSLARLVGYASSALSNSEYVVPEEARVFLREEQLRRIKNRLGGRKGRDE